MPLISLIVYIAVIGLVLWLVTTYIPMPDPIKKILVVVVVVALVIWLLTMLLPLGGAWGPCVGYGCRGAIR